MIRRLAIAVAVAGLLAAAVGWSPAVAADQPTFGTPTATSAFLSRISLSEPVTLPAGVTGIDALVRTEGSPRTLAAPIQLPGSGQQQLRYVFMTPSGALSANTRVELQFRVTLADGSTVLGPVATVSYDDSRFAWKTLAGSVVRVHWTDGDQAFGQRALSIAEKAVSDAATLLGVTETKPIDFFIYADRTAFYDVIGPALQENIGGLAEPPIRTLFANIGASELNASWVGTVIPHELTHIVFADATANPYHEPLHWLNEGLAVYLSAGYDSGSRDAVRSAVSDGSLMPLSALANGFPGAADRFALAYDEAVSAIDFMVRTYGRDALVRLVTSYAGGLTDDEAFKSGIGADVATFEKAWLSDLGAPAPSPFGPQPAPPGPVPSGWGGTAPIPGLASGSPAGPTSGGGSTTTLGLAAGITAVILVAALVIVLLIVSRRTRRRALAGADRPGTSGPVDRELPGGDMPGGGPEAGP